MDTPEGLDINQNIETAKIECPDGQVIEICARKNLTYHLPIYNSKYDVMKSKPPAKKISLSVDNVYIDYKRIDILERSPYSLSADDYDLELTIGLGRLLGGVASYKESSPAQRVLLEKLETNSAKKVLRIKGHGGSQTRGVWVIGNRSFSIDFLLNLLSKETNPLKINLSDYTCILLDACNPTEEIVNQEIVDKLGLPIFYLHGNSSMLENRTLQLVNPNN